MTTTEVSKHLDFLELSAGELKFFLQKRGLTVQGNHPDLAARALVAYEQPQNYPIRDSAESTATTLQRNYSETLMVGSLNEDPLQVKE